VLTEIADSGEKGKTVIRLVNVEKSYQSGAGRTWVLRRIDLEIREGDFVTIMGPSGAGKSTLMGIIGMLDGDWQGAYHLLEHAVHKLDNRRRAELHKRYIGFVFQQYHLLDDLTVAENLDLPLSYRDISKSERQALVGDTLDRFQIVGKKSLYPSQLSGGQQQLVAVARAIIGKPKLILADEPTGSLHSSQGKMIMDLLKKLNDQGTTIIQVTHNDAWAAYGKRIVQLTDGWIVDGRSRTGAA
jgi:putative ABC transport system ATP-binding protein